MRFAGASRWRVLWAVAALGLGNPAAEAAVRPDYFGAKQFSLQLQEDFAKRRSKALIERIDSGALRARAFSTFGQDVIDSPRTAALWDQNIYPGLVRELAVYDTLTQLVACRIELLDSSRVVDCVVLNEKGEFRGLMIWLGQGSDGTTTIVDFRFLGSSQEFSRRVRQILILFGFEAAGVPDNEELALEELGRKNQHAIKGAFNLMAADNQDGAFQFWSEADPELQNTRIWKDLRSTMAANGSESARRQIEREQGEAVTGDGFTRYVLALGKGDRKQALEALDDVLVQTHNLGFFRLLKASLLLDSGHPDEALAAAEELYTLEPLMVGPHILAIRAALGMGKTEAAIRSLRHWNLGVASGNIEVLLPNDPVLAKFRASREYQDWKRAVDATPGVTSARSPAAPSPH